MSRKWQQVKRWDEEHLRGPLTPLRWVLRLFSSVVFGISLLAFVALYGVVASIPIGMLVKGLSWAIYCVSVAAVAGGLALGLGMATRRLLAGAGRGWRFAAVLGAVLVGGGLGVLAWYEWLWPVLHYDPVRQTGLRLFPEVVDRYRDVTIRRLPFFEMTELEFYAWWPMRAALLAFVLTMVVSTVRRIAFTLPNIGVLTVHTGIILLGLGSMYYSSLKLEGDVLLLAGPTGPDGLPTAGPPQGGFYDRTKVALWVSNGRGWDQRVVEGVPRYNAYGLDAGAARSALGEVQTLDLSGVPPRELDLAVPPSRIGVSDNDVRYHLVGYAPYAEERSDWVPADSPGPDTHTLRFVEMLSSLTADGRAADPTRPVFRFFFVADRPRLRVAEIAGVFAVEYAAGMDAARWADATSAIPGGGAHGLSITLADGTREVVAVSPGSVVERGGYRFAVERLLDEPPFPIITEGYEDATSAVAVVRVTPPSGEPFTRWIYARYPELSQDLADAASADGRPARTDADESGVRLGYVRGDGLRVVIDEHAPGVARVAVRQPGGAVRTIEDVSAGERFEVIDRIELRLGERWEHARPFPRPQPVPRVDREGDFIGTHDRAMLAVELSLPQSGWRRVVWLPFSRYLNIGGERGRAVELPDGRRVRLAFGRARRVLPGFQISMVDFEMVSYDHRGAPRDYASTVRVEPTGVGRTFEPYVRRTSLNAPLRAPFVWSDSRSWPANALGLLASRLDPGQFKFAQSGWDAQGWERTQAQADAGEVPEPYAQFTILHVGNNPGIHVIALGGVLMGVGTPWAFYVKPWMVKRRKRRLAIAAMAAATGDDTR